MKANNNITRKQIMIAAWTIARTAAQMFGGKAAQYLSEAMKMAWRGETISPKVEEFFLDTVKYAGTMASGYKESLYHVELKNETAYISYAEVSFPDGYRNGKQNECRMECENAAIYTHNMKRNSEPELWGQAETILRNAKEVNGETYNVKSIIKDFGFRWNGETKSWVK